jgi:capsular polysaccharide export protein
MTKVLLLAVNRTQERYFSTISACDENIKALHVKRLPIFFSPKRLSVAESQAFRKALDLRMRTIDQESVNYRVKYHWRWVVYAKNYVSTYIFIQRTSAYFRSESFDLVGLWNGLKWRQQLVSEILRREGMDKLYFENGAIPGTTTVDPKGVNYVSSIPRDPEFYMSRTKKNVKLPSKLVERETKKRPSTTTYKTLPGKYIFVPFQVDSDTQITEFSDWIKNMRHLFDVISALKERLGDEIPDIVIKEHPSSKNSYEDLHGLNQKLRFYNDTSTQELIENASFIITINSSVGVEALLFKKPVIVLGQAFYGMDGLVQLAGDEQKLIEACLNVCPPNEKLRINFFSYLYEEYYVCGDWKKPGESHISSVIKLIGREIESAK